jgi:SAM-dependent methyltransferase
VNGSGPGEPSRPKRLFRSVVPLPARKRLAVWLGTRGPVSERYGIVFALLRDWAGRNPSAFHRFLWSHHLAYAESYEPGRRFGPEQVHPTRHLLFADLTRVLRERGARDVRSVLEVGCSLGYLLRHIETEVFPGADRLDGIDIDGYAIRAGEEFLQREGSRVRLAVADVASLAEREPSTRYDVTLCAGVLLYLPEPEATRVVAGVLAATNGLAAFAGLAHPDRDNAQLEHSAIRERDGTFIHDVEKMVRAAGGEVVL